MTTLPVKMLTDESGNNFVPISSTIALLDTQGQTLDAVLATKLETSSILAGSGVTLTVDTTNHTVTINSTVPGANVIDNLTTATAGLGVLDAHQGYVLDTAKVNVNDIVDNCTTTVANKPLSAYQGYVLFNKFSDYALSTAIPTQTSQLTNNSHFAVTNADNNFTIGQTLKGVDLKLGTTGTSSNDSGDLVWQYGNGNEKARLWAEDSMTSSVPNLYYRSYDTSGTQIVNTTLLTSADFVLDGTTLYITTH